MEKLPEYFKRKWVDALRSREYTQGRYQLYDEAFNGYCCLGVLGAVRGFTQSEMKGKSNPDIGDIYPKVCDGLEEGFWKALIHMNDSGGKSFSEIADYIEQNL